jgi:hypothetical protein
MTNEPLRRETKTLLIKGATERIDRNSNPFITFEVNTPTEEYKFPVKIMCWNPDALTRTPKVGEVLSLVVEAKETKTGKPDDGTFWNYDWVLMDVLTEGDAPEDTFTPYDGAPVVVEGQKAPSPSTPGVPTPTYKDGTRDSIEKQVSLKEATEMARWYHGDTKPESHELLATVEYFYQGYVDLLQGDLNN